ncbi:MAG: hypothetical protein HDT20_08340 [Oscillibacter sp.]|nr:hypothetical protein [Oscillibacter sp.]
MEDFETQVEIKQKKENVVGGIVGAFLGSLLGVACIVIVGQMGYVASICGLVMAVCSLKGYELLSGGMSKKGAVISSVVILLMTYLAHQLDWAISVASAWDEGIFDCFRAIPYLREAGYIEGGSYWGGLAMLYIFTLVGAVPTVLAGLHGDSTPDLPAGQVAIAGEAETEVELYPSEKKWANPLRFSASLSMLFGVVIGLVMLLLWMGKTNEPEGAPIWWLFAALGCLGSCFVMMFIAWPKVMLCDSDFQVLARSNGTVWKIRLSALNVMDTYRFTKKNGNIQALRWEKLSAEDQARARVSITRAIGLLQSGQVMGGSALSRAVMPLTDLEITGEDHWRWKGTYSVRNGKRKKVSIAKAFPNFAPVQGMERPDGPMPWRWSLFVTALVLALLFGGAAALAGGDSIRDTLDLNGPGKTKEPPTAQAPESTEIYTVDNVTFQMDAALEADSDHEFSDPDRDLSYSVSVLHGQSRDDATEVLMEPIGENRLKTDFQGFSFLYAAEEDVIIPMTAADGAEYQHGLLTVNFTDGSAIQKAVALAEDGTLFTVTAQRGKKVKEADVNAALLYILESAQVTAQANPLAEITEENYQSLFRLYEEEYETIGVGYIKVPEDMFGYADAFVDVYVPYSDAPEYLNDGYAIRSAAHGMEVTVTMAYTDGNAADVVDEAADALINSGVYTYEEGIGETQYVEDYDIAYKQVLYLTEDNEEMQLAVLYADTRDNGYYYSAQITYQLERTDDLYSVTVAELGDVFALSLPEFDPM